MEEQRKKIIDIENSIIAITGSNIEEFVYRNRNTEKMRDVASLLEKRQFALNEMFEPSGNNLKHFKETNGRLYNLTCRLFERVQAFQRKKSQLMDCPEFDDDYEINGTLRFYYNDIDSILSFSDDEVYGSDFKTMISLISACLHDTYAENIESFSPMDSMLDDGVSWTDYPFRSRNEYDDIIICHAVHQLTEHQLYSIPDLIRLNDFWAEVNFKVQSITDLKGNRWLPQNS